MMQTRGWARNQKPDATADRGDDADDQPDPVGTERQLAQAVMGASVEPPVRTSRGAGDRLRPTCQQEVALGGVHRRLPAVVLAASCARRLVEAGPEAGREPGGVGRAERGRLATVGRIDGDAEDVGLELHEHVVGDHAAVDPQLGDQARAESAVDSIEHLAGLVRRGLERRRAMSAPCSRSG